MPHTSTRKYTARGSAPWERLSLPDVLDWCEAVIIYMRDLLIQDDWPLKDFRLLYQVSDAQLRWSCTWGCYEGFVFKSDYDMILAIQSTPQTFAEALYGRLEKAWDIWQR